MEKIETRKAPGALDPLLFSLPSGYKLYDGHSRYEPKWCSGSLRQIFVSPSKKRKSGMGLVADKKRKMKNTKGKMGITRPHPDGRVITIFWRQ